ncbi:MAG: BMP family ABC transporter substrate-binding protein [Eubacteriales bacterium]
MKKTLVLLLVLAMVFSLAACAKDTTEPATEAVETETDAEPATETEAEDMMPASDIPLIAFCSDVGTIDDESFNQYSYAGVVSVCEAYGIEYEYFVPAEDSTEQRQTNIRQAVSDGAACIVVTGYLYGEALAWAAAEYPDVNFIGIDVSEYDIVSYADAIPANVRSIVYHEEQAGYLAGYAAVKDGYTELGFLGGMAVPAVVRYGYGYVQGADAAAAEMGTDININYYYGGQFYGDASITAKMEGWYSNGTEIVFACGGGIYTSAVEAALNYDGKVIGVDVDQNYLGLNGVADGTYAYNPFVTSAYKSLQTSVEDVLNEFVEGNWIGGVSSNLGLAEGDYVGLPTGADSWNFATFTVDDYNTVVEGIRDGSITVDPSSDTTTTPAVSDFTTVNYIS